MRRVFWVRVNAALLFWHAQALSDEAGAASLAVPALLDKAHYAYAFQRIQRHGCVGVAPP
jgi:hypothetical protein